MISVKYSDIPLYLQSGEFYRSLSSEDNDEEIFVPEDSFKATDVANSVEEFAQLLRTLLFWGLSTIPVGVIDFCNKQLFAVWGQAAAHALGGKSQGQSLSDLIVVFKPKPPGIIDRAMQIGRTEIVNYMIDVVGPEILDTATITAARIGSLDYLQLLHVKGYKWGAATCAAAAYGGHLQCLVYLHEHSCLWDIDTYIYSAAFGHLACMKYAFENGLAWKEDVCTEAAEKNQVEMLQFAHEHGCSWDENVTLVSARLGHLNILRYALQHGCAIHKDSINEACVLDNVDLVTLLHEYDAPWGTEACDMAAGCGHLEVLQYLHENHCPWDEATTDWAAFNGELITLEYAIRNGCPWSEDVLRRAALCGRLDCLQFLADQTLYMDVNGSLFGAALRQGHYKCVEYLLDTSYAFMNYVFDDTLDDLLLFAPSGSDEDFYQGMVLALERGWQPNEQFLAFARKKNIQACDDYFASEGYMM